MYSEMGDSIVDPESGWLYLVALCPAVVVLIFYWYVYRPQQYFKSIGVPGPEPCLLTGNLSLFFSFKGEHLRFFKHLQETYGDVCGYYMCQRPFLVLHDPDFVKQITIKDFDKFADHFENGGLVPYWADNGKQYYGLLITQGHHWRSARNIVTPTFSTHKMKLMEPLIHTSTSRLAEKLDSVASTGQSIDVSQYYSKMTMEVILATAFGRSLDVQNGKGGKLYASALTAFTYFQSNTGLLIKLILMIENSWPITKSIIRRLVRYTSAGEAMQYLGESVKLMIEQRRKGGPEAERKDLLQLMMDANAASEEKLDDGQMIGTAIGFLLGGYETTSSALSFASYLLALNPAIQDKLANEIHDYQETHPDASLYDTAQEIEYLNMVFDEALRLYPPGIAIMRLCGENCTVKGIPIKKGIPIIFPLFSYHRQPDIWPDPEKFDPGRFSAEEKSKRHPYAYLPFGVGPRSCVGMRLALLEAKMTLIEVLTKYRLVRSTETEVPLQLKYGMTMAAKNGVLLKIEKRNWD